MVMKMCKKCGAKKPRSEFYKHPRMGDGLLSHCKECVKARVRENRHKKIDYYMEWDRQRNSKPHRVAARKAYQLTERGKERMRAAKQKYDERYPEKRKAHYTLNNAIRSGVVAKEPCECCGSTDRIHGHHDDYGNPLDVRWLCPTCHSWWHKLQNSVERKRSSVC